MSSLIVIRVMKYKYIYMYNIQTLIQLFFTDPAFSPGAFQSRQRQRIIVSEHVPERHRRIGRYIAFESQTLGKVSRTKIKC